MAKIVAITGCPTGALYLVKRPMQALATADGAEFEWGLQSAAQAIPTAVR